MRLDKWLMLRREQPEGQSQGGAGGGDAGAGTAGSGGADGSAADWRSALPEYHEPKDAKGQPVMGPDGKPVRVPLRGSERLARYKGMDTLAVAYLELEKAHSAAVRLPGPDAKPEEVRAFRDKLGLPKDVAGYAEVKIPEVEGISPDLPALEQAKAVALAEGISPATLQKLVNWQYEREKSAQQRLIASWDPAKEELEQEWGANYERNVGLARDGLAYAFGAEWEQGEFGKLFGASGLHYHPEAFKAFAKFGARLAEHDVIKDQRKPGQTPADAEARLGVIQRDPAYLDKNAPTHAALVEEAYRLRQILHPEPV
jgi:hypothetical protein